MIPREFEYRAPKTLMEALGLLKRLGDGAKLLAGVTYRNMPRTAYRMWQQCKAPGLTAR